MEIVRVSDETIGFEVRQHDGIGQSGKSDFSRGGLISLEEIATSIFEFLFDKSKIPIHHGSHLRKDFVFAQLHHRRHDELDSRVIEWEEKLLPVWQMVGEDFLPQSERDIDPLLVRSVA